MMSRRASALLLLPVLLLSPLCLAAELGDPAAPLEIKDWVKGEPLTLEEAKGKVVVVEFWATWCPPCRTSIPHLTELQKKYQDKLVMIGVSNEPAQVIQPFVDKMGEEMAYHVAADNENKTMMAYMRAFDQTGIPWAFIVDQQGRIAWHDSPLSPVFEEVLDKVVQGSFDHAQYAAEQKQREENLALANKYVKDLMDAAPEAETRALGEQVLQVFNDDVSVLVQIALVLSSDDFKDKTDLEMAAKAADRAVALTESKQAMALQAKARVLEVQGKQAEALKVQQQAIEVAETPEEKEYLQERYDEIAKSGTGGAQAAS